MGYFDSSYRARRGTWEVGEHNEICQDFGANLYPRAGADLQLRASPPSFLSNPAPGDIESVTLCPLKRLPTEYLKSQSAFGSGGSYIGRNRLAAAYSSLIWQIAPDLVRPRDLEASSSLCAPTTESRRCLSGDKTGKREWQVSASHFHQKIRAHPYLPILAVFVLQLHTHLRTGTPCPAESISTLFPNRRIMCWGQDSRSLSAFSTSGGPVVWPTLLASKISQITSLTALL